MLIGNPREGLRRYPFVKRSGTKDLAESPARPFREGHAHRKGGQAQINKKNQ